MTIQTFPRRHANPAFAHAVLFDIGLFVAVEADADAAGEKRLVVVRAAGVNRKSVGKGFAHRSNRLWAGNFLHIRQNRRKMQAFSIASSIAAIFRFEFYATLHKTANHRFTLQRTFIRLP